MKTASIARLVAICAALSSCQGPPPRDGSAPGYAEAAFAAYPGTTIRYYDVDGTDPKAIRDSLKALGQPGRDGKTYAASTYWRAQWHWSANADGSCDLAHMTYEFHITVTLPRLHDRARIEPTLRQSWARYMAALIDHELGHARHGYDHRDDIADAVRSSRCENANAAGEAVIQELSRYDVEYDAETHHGATQGAVFP